MSGDAAQSGSRRLQAIDRLPLPYSEALRLRAAGIGDELIASILGVDIEALPGVYALAEDKIAAILDNSGRPSA